MVRGIGVRAAFAAVALAVMVAVPVVADTGGGAPNGDMDVASGSTTGSVTWFQLARDNLAGTARMNLSLDVQTGITCADGTTSYTEETFDGNGPATNVVFGRSESSASGTATVTGSGWYSDYCTGDSWQTAVSTHTVSVSMTGSKLTTTTTTKQTTKNPDGTTTVFTDKSALATASGFVTVDGGTALAAPGQIYHETWTTRTR